MGDEKHMFYCIIDCAITAHICSTSCVLIQKNSHSKNLSFYWSEERPLNDCAYNSISNIKFVICLYKTAFVNYASCAHYYRIVK